MKQMPKFKIQRKMVLSCVSQDHEENMKANKKKGIGAEFAMPCHKSVVTDSALDPGDSRYQDNSKEGEIRADQGAKARKGIYGCINRSNVGSAHCGDL